MLALAGPARSVAIDPPVLLAPMEGITDGAFRGMVARLGGVGAAVCEFLRISVAPVPPRVCRRELGAAIGVPVAIQLMAAGPEHVAASASAAERAGAAWVDLNFGCPAPVVFGKCAGSALLAHPGRMAAIIAAAVGATGLPVTAKMRAGIASPAHLGELVCAAAEAGVAAITVHARLRTDSYATPATWAWLAEAATALRRSRRRIPLIGNGGIEEPGDIARMRTETGVDAVMVGRAALADPFIFRVAAGGPPPSRGEAVAWALAYIDAMGGGGPKAKQLVRYWRAAGMLDDPDERTRLLRGEADGIRAWFAANADPPGRR